MFSVSRLQRRGAYVAAVVLVIAGAMIAMDQWPGGNRCVVDRRDVACLTIGPPPYGSWTWTTVGLMVAGVGVLLAAGTWFVGRRQARTTASDLSRA